MIGHASHQQTLIRHFLQTEGPILELGAGWYSTPILHELSAALQRPLITVEHDQYFIDRFTHLQSHLHAIVKVTTYDDFTPADHYGLALIDHAPAERRIVDIARLVGRVGLFIIHDTESPEYGYETIWPLLDVIEVDKTIGPWTTVAKGRL